MQKLGYMGEYYFSSYRCYITGSILNGTVMQCSSRAQLGPPFISCNTRNKALTTAIAQLRPFNCDFTSLVVVTVTGYKMLWFSYPYLIHKM